MGSGKMTKAERDELKRSAELEAAARKPEDTVSASRKRELQSAMARTLASRRKPAKPKGKKRA